MYVLKLGQYLYDLFQASLLVKTIICLGYTNKSQF